MSEKKDYVIVRNQCSDAPSILRGATEEILASVLEEFQKLGDTRWDVYELGEKVLYQVKPSVIYRVPKAGV